MVIYVPIVECLDQLVLFLKSNSKRLMKLKYLHTSYFYLTLRHLNSPTFNLTNIYVKCHLNYQEVWSQGDTNYY